MNTANQYHIHLELNIVYLFVCLFLNSLVLIKRIAFLRHCKFMQTMKEVENFQELYPLKFFKVDENQNYVVRMRHKNHLKRDMPDFYSKLYSFQ